MCQSCLSHLLPQLLCPASTPRAPPDPPFSAVAGSQQRGELGAGPAGRDVVVPKCSCHLSEAGREDVNIDLFY